MIKLTQAGEPSFIPGQKILNEIKYLHQEMPTFCYSWIWEAKCVNAMEKEDFQDQILELKSVGCVRRSEVYAKQAIQIGKNKFYVRLVSYGSSNVRKMFLGPSNLAHAFDKLMFDYVFIFLEKEPHAQKKMRAIILKAQEKNDQKTLKNITNSLKYLLGVSDTEIQELLNKSSQ